jgi:hypothetical protein
LSSVEGDAVAGAILLARGGVTDHTRSDQVRSVVSKW